MLESAKRLVRGRRRIGQNERVVSCVLPESDGCVTDRESSGCILGDVLHGSARTTPYLRAELKASKESTRALAARYGLNPKTVAK